MTKREKRACKACEEQGVQSAPLPTRIIDKGLASDRVVIDTVVSKYADHVPLYRQSAILERETGIELSRATLDGWVAGTLGTEPAGANRTGFRFSIPQTGPDSPHRHRLVPGRI